MMTEQNWLPYAESLVEELDRQGVITADWLRESLLHVPRHLFIDRYYQYCEEDNSQHLVCLDAEPTDEQMKHIYSDTVLPIRQDPNYSSSSQPSLMMLMLADLDVKPGHRVLEIGTGSGWNAGLLAHVVGDQHQVFSVDIQADLVEEAKAHLVRVGLDGVNVKANDGGLGWAEASPFDRIMLTVGSGDISTYWLDQLSENGVLLLPFTTARLGNPLLRLRKVNGKVMGEFTRWAYFGDLQGSFSRDSEGSHCSAEVIDRLMAGEPVRMALPEPMVKDFCFFLYLIRAPFHYRMSNYGGPMLLSAESESLCVLKHGEGTMEVRGDVEAGKALICKLEEWIGYGRPKIADYRVELLERPLSSVGPREWLDERHSVCLKLFLP